MTMKTLSFRLLAVVFLGNLCATPAIAQYARKYIFIGPGAVSSQGHSMTTYELGGGLERLFNSSLGAGVEAGALFRGDAAQNSTVGVFSLNGYYHFVSDGTVDPFITGGYSVLFRDSTKNAFNFGGGCIYWFDSDHGLLIEGIDNRGRNFGSLPAPEAHYGQIRIGISFR